MGPSVSGGVGGMLLLLLLVYFAVAAAAADLGQSSTAVDVSEVTTTGSIEYTGTSERVPQPPVSSSSPGEQRSVVVEEEDALCSSSAGDSVGRHLGCSCVSLDTGGGLLEADCSEKWIGNNNLSFPLTHLNISVYVRLLDLSGNELGSLPSSSFGSCDSVFSLSLRSNYLRGDLSGLGVCKFLQKVDLSWNRLTALEEGTFKGLGRLRELDLSYNNITVVDGGAFRDLVSLRRLVLSSNPLGMELKYGDDYTLDLGGMKELEVLDLSNCSFPDFPLYLFGNNGSGGSGSNLKKLILKNNMISYLSEGVVHQLSGLEVLDLSGNWFETLAGFSFVGMSSLRSLRVDRMPFLKRIDAHAFAGLVALKELFCQKNHFLNQIDPMAFRVAEGESELGSCSPRVVKLGDNNLGSFEFGLLDWVGLESLELHRNPWECDCNLQWVAEFYRKKKGDAAILADSDFICGSPHIFAGVPVVRVDPDEMLCGSEWAPVAGGVGIFLFGFLLFTFCSVIILNHMGILPEWVRRWNVFGSGSTLPKYSRVNPKPSRARGAATKAGADSGSADPPYPGDLEWDASTDDYLGGGDFGGGVRSSSRD